MRIYLGGPINGCTDEEANDWRTAAKHFIENEGHEWVDPMDRDYRGREMEPGVDAEIVEYDKQDIDGCDVVIAYCPKPSSGTACEVLYAWGQGKRVVLVAPLDANVSPWLTYHADLIFRSSVLAALRTVLSA